MSSCSTSGKGKAKKILQGTLSLYQGQLQWLQKLSLCVCVHVSLCVYVCACMCLCVCACICVCVIFSAHKPSTTPDLFSQGHMSSSRTGYLGSSTRCQPGTGDHFQTSVVCILSSEWLWMQLWRLLKVLCVVSHLFIFLLPSESSDLRKLCIIGGFHWFFKIKIIPNILGN